MLSLEVTNNNEFLFHGRSINITRDKNQLLAPFGKMISNYGVVLSLVPTEEQVSLLNQQIGNARFVRNRYLADRMEYYEENKETLSVSQYKKEILPQLKEENPFLLLSDKFALESALEHIDFAYTRFFEGIKKGQKMGFPKFASKFKPNGNAYTTKYTNGNIGLLMVDNLPYVKLPKIGKVRFVLPVGKTINSILPNNTRITSASVQRFGGKYTVSLQLEAVIDVIHSVGEIRVSDIISSDMGIKNFAVYGNTEFTEEVENPRFIKVHEKRLRRLQKSLSRKKKFSNNWKKAKLRITKEHRKIKNQRRDFHHKLSRNIVNNCNVFVCEDLNIKGMVKNRHLAKEISSVGWGQFLSFVKYKMERKGGIFLKVDRFYASSQLCSSCGYKNPEVKDLKVRKWTCPECGTIHDRDENAKINLLNKAIELLNTDYDIQVVA